MRRLALVGGGRWARVLAGTLAEIVPPAVRIDIHTKSNAAGMREWAAGRGAGRIAIADAPLDLAGARRPDAIIIANAARDHVAPAAKALHAGIPTLVEKPLTLSAGTAADLVELARRHNAPLAVSRVMLFARYVEALMRAAATRADIKEVRVIWADPKGETRYGEVKRYDAGVTVANDVLPHILPVLRALFGDAITFVDVTIARGGMQTEVSATAGSVPCVLSLARNSDARRRVIELQTADGPLRLDCSEEPGRITTHDAEYDADPAWQSAPRPLARMLCAFLDGVAGGVLDERLAAASAVEEIRIADQALERYRVKQAEWLAPRVGKPMDDGIRYAMAEILTGVAPREPLGDERIALAWASMAALGAENVVAALGNAIGRKQEITSLLGRSG